MEACMRFGILLFIVALCTILSCSHSNPVSVSEPALNELGNLKDSANTVDYLVVCADPLVSSAQAFCDYRKTRLEAGLDLAALVRLLSINKAFPGSDSALKDFLRFIWSAWSRPPQYVLLLGADKVNGDPGQGIPTGDTSENASVASDNCFTDANNDSNPEYCLGRIPAQTNAEAITVLDKIRNYEEQSSIKRIALAADDHCQWQAPDGADALLSFETVMRQISAVLDTGFFQVDSFKLADYVQNCNWNDSLSGLARADFYSFLNKGAAFFCFIGHS